MFNNVPQQLKQPVAAQVGSKPDPYNGHKNTARLCARLIMHSFVCPEYSHFVQL